MSTAFQSSSFKSAAEFFGPLTGHFGAPDLARDIGTGILLTTDNRFSYRERPANRAGVHLHFFRSTGGLSQSTAEYEVAGWNRVLVDDPRSRLHEKFLTLWHKNVGLVALDRIGEGKNEIPSPSATAQMRVDRLVDLQSELGFNTQDFAAVLGITRQQLYKWLNASTEVRLQEGNRARLQTVERIAKEWKRHSEAPLSAVAFEELEPGVSAYTLLTQSTIDERLIFAEMARLLALMASRPSTRSERLVLAGVKRRPSVQSLRTDE